MFCTRSKNGKKKISQTRFTTSSLSFIPVSIESFSMDDFKIYRKLINYVLIFSRSLDHRTPASHKCSQLGSNDVSSVYILVRHFWFVFPEGLPEVELMRCLLSNLLQIMLKFWIRVSLLNTSFSNLPKTCLIIRQKYSWARCLLAKDQ